jgi:hypothetical protein
VKCENRYFNVATKDEETQPYVSPPPLLFLLQLTPIYKGIGVPATAASGAITANNLVSVQDHWGMLNKIRLPKK